MNSSAEFELPPHNNWSKVSIGSIISGLYDGPHATPKPSDDGPIFLGIKNITDDGMLDLSQIRHISEEEYPKWTRRVTPQANDIVFTYEATLNRYAVIPEGFRGCLGRRLALIRPDTSKVDVKFLFYYFFSREWREIVSKYTLHGATVDRIPLTKFPEFEVPLPPLAIQQRIASVLSAYDDLIENNMRRTAILEEMAHLNYREWLVHFRFPGREGVEMVEAEGFGRIPQGWKLSQLGQIAKEIRRSIDPKQIDSDTPYIGLGHMPKRSIALTEWGTSSEVNSTKLAFNRGEILFGKIRPYFHKVGVAPIDGVASTDAIVIVPDEPRYFAITLCCVSSEEFVAQATQTSKGTKMPRADWNVLVKYPILIPSKTIFDHFNEVTEVIVSQILNMIHRNIVLKQMRDLLLPLLISGSLDISKLDIPIRDKLFDN